MGLNPDPGQALLHPGTDAVPATQRLLSHPSDRLLAGVASLGLSDGSNSAGQQGEGLPQAFSGTEGLPLIKFAENPGGSRRFLVSRSGHVFVARGEAGERGLFDVPQLGPRKQAMKTDCPIVSVDRGG